MTKIKTDGDRAFPGSARFKFIKAIAILCLAMLLIVVVPLSALRFMTTGSILRAPNATRMERDLIRYRESMDTIIKYLISSTFSQATIWRANMSDDGNVELSVAGRRFAVEDSEAAEAVCYLFRRGFRVISINEQVVSFQRWSNLNAGRGIAFSADGSTPDKATFEFLIELTPLSEAGWYFFVEDFNEWRRRNQ